jgi:hypothetical protein
LKPLSVMPLPFFWLSLLKSPFLLLMLRPALDTLLGHGLSAARAPGGGGYDYVGFGK